MTSNKDSESVDYEKLSDLLKANSELTKDVCMLKQLVYCLNSQLGRYQKLYFLNQKSPSHPKKAPTNVIPPLPEGFGSSDTLENYLQNASRKGSKISKFERPCDEKIVYFNEKSAKEESSDPQVGVEEMKIFGKIPKKSDAVGSKLGNWDLLTLSPLLDAYEETIKEKDDIIKSYEQKMLALGQKCREVVLENEALYEEREKLLSKSQGNLGKNSADVNDHSLFLEEQNKLLKEYLDLEKEKFIEVHEIYESKVTELTEELNRIREEQRQCMAELSDARGRCAFLEGEVGRLRRALDEESIPLSVHNQSIEECKRLLEELRMQYERDNLNTLTKLKEIERAKMKLMAEVAELTDLKDKSDKLLRTKEHLLRYRMGEAGSSYL
ncbi:centrosomal protein of 89 kDa isoform X2 [Ischnura elegans]|uniref:centrosomal protein of 89 kDa isoform X2 n=1 Tax=Ischnura elegans TaxID=197161 RepID=UPI001ED8740E|nr:centrosomal protein of 89 kDa isoform X2 [Ischnura elegans]